MFWIFLMIPLYINFQIGESFIIKSDKDDRSSAQSQGFFGYLYDAYSDEGVPSEVTFVTKLKHKRDLSKHDYHIVEVRLISEEIKFSIHLSRNYDLANLQVSPELIVKDEAESVHIDLQNCFYTGIISDLPGGRAALSACGDQPGFSGHILLGDEHLVLEPDMSNTSSHHGNEKPTLLHRVYRATNIAKKENSTHSDMRRVPKDELKKAVAEMANSTQGKEDVPDEDNDETQTQKPGSAVGALIDSDDDTNDQFGIELQTYAKKKNPSKSKESKKLTVAGIKIIEIAVFTDSKLYEAWKKRYAKDTKLKLKGFILSMVNNMNLLYQHPSLGVDIAFRLVYLEILQKSVKGLDSSEGESTKYLKSFCKYAGDKNDKGADWDHALLLTGYDLTEEGDRLITGMAWFSTMCLKYWSCSISEGTSFGSTFTIAHELGHSIGMEHDGESSSKACDQEKYIMSPTTGAGKITWSKCSSQNLKDFITKGSSDLEKTDLASIPACITRASPLKNQRIKFATKGGKLPGQIYNANIQCQYDRGSQYSEYTSSTLDSCLTLWCSKPDKTAGSLKIKEGHPPLEGTKCGTGKYCRYGKCVKNKKAR